MAILIQGEPWCGKVRSWVNSSCASCKRDLVQPHSWCRLLLGLVLALSACTPITSAQNVTESEVKAAFLYNFAKFVEWPEDRFTSPSDPVRLCVFGGESLESDLRQVVNGKSIGTRPVQIQRVGLPQVKHCHVLFLGASESQRLPQVLEAARSGSVLTVGDFPGFTEQGGVISLVVDENRIRFEVNLKAAQEARLKLSSKLLSLAKSVQM